VTVCPGVVAADDKDNDDCANNKLYVAAKKAITSVVAKLKMRFRIKNCLP
jgi:hypothetical protein